MIDWEELGTREEAYLSALNNVAFGWISGLNTNGASNGNYSPMRVYHEERSRKGHFRY